MKQIKLWSTLLLVSCSFVVSAQNFCLTPSNIPEFLQTVPQNKYVSTRSNNGYEIFQINIRSRIVCVYCCYVAGERFYMLINGLALKIFYHFHLQITHSTRLLTFFRCGNNICFLLLRVTELHRNEQQTNN